jgi:hypothetical protein
MLMRKGLKTMRNKLECFGCWWEKDDDEGRVENYDAGGATIQPFPKYQPGDYSDQNIIVSRIKS